MKKVIILFIIIMFSGIEVFAQDSLVFKLEVDVRAKHDGPWLPGADVRVIGSDMSMQVKKTDSSGHAEFNLKPETSYSVDVFSEYFLVARGNETTKGEKESKVFYHLYQLQSVHGFHPIPLYYFDEGSTTPSKDTSLVGNLLNKGEEGVLTDFLNSLPDAVIAVYGSISENEDPKLKDDRAMVYLEALLSLGIDPSRIVIDHTANDVTKENTLQNISYNSAKAEWVPKEFWDRCAGLILQHPEEEQGKK